MLNIDKYIYYHQHNGEAGHFRNSHARGLGVQPSAFSVQLPAFCLPPSAYCLLPSARQQPPWWVARGRLSPEELLSSRGARYRPYNTIRVNHVKQKILPLGKNLLKRARGARGPYSRGRHARENVAQGSRSSLAAFPPRRGFGGAAYENSDYLVGGAATTRTAGKAAGPEGGPSATGSKYWRTGAMFPINRCSRFCLRSG